MSHKHRSSILIFLTLLGVLGTMSPMGIPAQAAKKEPLAVAAFLNAFAQQFGVKPNYRRYRTAEDGSVTVRGFTTEQTAPDPNAPAAGTTLSAETVTFSKPETEANGLLDISETKFSNLIAFYSDGEGTATALRLPEGTISHLVLRPLSSTSPSSIPEASSSALLKSVAAPQGVLSSGGISLQIGEMHMDLEGDPIGGAGNFEITIGNMHYPSSAISRSDPSGTVLSLLGGDLILDLTMNGETHVNGNVQQGEFSATINVHSVGVLRLSGQFERSPDTRIASLSDGEPARLAALSPLLQPVILTNFSLRYEDLAGVQKLLAMLATDQNVDVSVLVDRAVASLKQLLAGLGNAALADQAVQAIGQFLREPRSLTIRSSPVHPVPMPTILRGVANDPNQLVNQLSLSITAND